MPLFRFLIGLSVLIGLSACATSVPQPNLGEYKHRLIHWHDSGHYDQAFATAAHPGVRFLQQRLARKKPGEQLAVVFDIDETLLTNWAYIHHRNFGVTSASFGEWVKSHNDPAMEPTRKIFLTAKELGIPIFLITGRPESLRTFTARQLRAQGLVGYSALYMKPDRYAQASIIPFKSGARRAITERGYTIVLNMGDQWSDLEGGFAEKRVKLPNPFYYIK